MTILVGILTGCNVVQDMENMMQKKNLVEEVIKDNYGLDSLVGWEVTNGIIKQITVRFNANDVRNEQVSKLESLVTEVVFQSFERKPQKIVIQIVTDIENNT